jgi:hypothetical protein
MERQPFEVGDLDAALTDDRTVAWLMFQSFKAGIRNKASTGKRPGRPAPMPRGNLPNSLGAANYWQEMTESGRNWTEDFSHENGQYICGCVGCGREFQGHKRRAVCKICAYDECNSQYA